MVCNPGFTEPEKLGNPEFSKPKIQFLAACKPSFFGFEFALFVSFLFIF